MNKHTWQQQKYYRVIMAEVAKETGYSTYWVEINIMKRISRDVYFWEDFKPLDKCRSSATFTVNEMSLVCNRFILEIWHSLEYRLPKENEESLKDKLHQVQLKTQIL